LLILVLPLIYSCHCWQYVNRSRYYVAGIGIFTIVSIIKVSFTIAALSTNGAHRPPTSIGKIFDTLWVLLAVPPPLLAPTVSLSSEKDPMLAKAKLRVFNTFMFYSPLMILAIPIGLMLLIKDIGVGIVKRLIGRFIQQDPNVKVSNKIVVANDESTVELGSPSKCPFAQVQSDGGAFIGDIFGYFRELTHGWKTWFETKQRLKVSVFGTNIGVPTVVCGDLVSTECLVKNTNILKDARLNLNEIFPAENLSFVLNLTLSGEVGRKNRDLLLSLVPKTRENPNYQRGFQALKEKMISLATNHDLHQNMANLHSFIEEIRFCFLSHMIFGKRLEQSLLDSISPFPFIFTHYPKDFPVSFLPHYYAMLQAAKELYQIEDSNEKSHWNQEVT
jgi:uncharacterized membrane protein